MSDDEIRRELNRLTTAILGDEEAGVEGMVVRQKRVEQEVTTIKRFIYRYYWIFVGAAGVISMFATATGFAIELYFRNK